MAPGRSLLDVMVRDVHQSAVPVEKRITTEDEIEFDSFWWSPTGYVVKWSIMVGLFAFISLYLLIGYMHAKKRMKKGLPPMKYHKFLVSRAERAQFEPNQRQFAMHPTQGPNAMYGQTYQTQNPDGSYTLHTYYPEPPPQYNHQGGAPGYPSEKEGATPPGVQPGLQGPPAPAPGVQQGLPLGEGGPPPGVQQGTHASSGQQDPGSGLRLPQAALNKIKAFKAGRR